MFRLETRPFITAVPGLAVLMCSTLVHPDRELKQKPSKRLPLKREEGLRLEALHCLLMWCFLFRQVGKLLKGFRFVVGPKLSPSFVGPFFSLPNESFQMQWKYSFISNQPFGSPVYQGVEMGDDRRESSPLHDLICGVLSCCLKNMPQTSSTILKQICYYFLTSWHVFNFFLQLPVSKASMPDLYVSPQIWSSTGFNHISSQMHCNP